MWMIAVVLAVVGVLLFVLPHHRGYESSASLAKDFRELLSEGQVESPAALILVMVVFVGCVAVLLPALLAGTTALLRDTSTPRVLIPRGVVLVVAGVLTFFVEVFSNMMIGWGGGSKYPETTPVAYLAPLFPIVCGIAAVVMGIRSRIP